MTEEEQLQEIARQVNDSGSNGDTASSTSETANNSGITQQATAKNSFVPEPQKHNPGFWTSGDIVDEVEAELEQKEVKPETTARTAAASNIQAPEAGAPLVKVTRDAISNSARTAVATINLAQLTIMRPLLNWRFKKESEKRFGQRLSRAQEMVMGDIAPTDDTERSLKKRFNNFLAQRDRKITGISFTDDEEKDMERALKSYFEMKQVTMSPEILLYCSVISTVGKRVVDVIVWD